MSTPTPSLLPASLHALIAAAAFNTEPLHEEVVAALTDLALALFNALRNLERIATAAEQLASRQ